MNAERRRSVLVERDPADTVALDRLAALATRAGEDKEVGRLRTRIAELTTAKDRYLSLIKVESAAGDPVELARLAGLLGRTTEARGWCSCVTES